MALKHKAEASKWKIAMHNNFFAVFCSCAVFFLFLFFFFLFIIKTCKVPAGGQRAERGGFWRAVSKGTNNLCEANAILFEILKFP